MKCIIKPYQDNRRPKCNYNTNIVPCCKTQITCKICLRKRTKLKVETLKLTNHEERIHATVKL